MLDIESRENLLSSDVFRCPYGYKLNISTSLVGESKEINVDLVETFNYLIGLTVKVREVVAGYVVVQGTLPNGERALVIWRDCDKQTNEDLEKFFAKQAYNTKDFEFDKIYVNGDNNLENIKVENDTWKVLLIEEEFKKRMFNSL
jgi:adenine-specific DNA-methyltransferase